MTLTGHFLIKVHCNVRLDIMAIQPKCDKCNEELVEFGAILLSPPDNNNMVLKYHLCVQCFNSIEAEFTNQ